MTKFDISIYKRADYNRMNVIFSIRQISIIWVPILLLAFCCGCTKKSTSEESYTKSKVAMDTVVTLTAYGSNSKKAVEASMKKIDEIENMISRQKSDSEISGVNLHAYDEEVEVSDELFYILEMAQEYSELSDGAFDITIGNLIDLWGIGTDHEKVPSKEELKPYISAKGYKKVKLDKEKKTVRFTSDQIVLDLGAIGKGYVADEIKKLMMDKYQIKRGIISLGGNIITIGSKTDKKGWSVGVQSPQDPDSLAEILEITDKTVVSSGNYERYFEKDGVRYHHILDPHTGYPAQSGLAGTTIIEDSSIQADILSTLTFILGPEKGMKLVESKSGVDAIFITNDNEEIRSDGALQYISQSE